MGQRKVVCGNCHKKHKGECGGKKKTIVGKLVEKPYTRIKELAELSRIMINTAFFIRQIDNKND